MSRRCQLTGLNNMSGNNVSHSNLKTKRKFKINLREVSCWSNLAKKHFRLKLSTKSLKTIDKLGGLDNYILSLKSKKVTEFAKILKRRFIKKNKAETT